MFALTSPADGGATRDGGALVSGDRPVAGLGLVERGRDVPGLPERVLYGVAYYAEYQPYDRLERDLDLMAEAGLTVIRVGESVWSTWEPEDGRFELGWLEPILDGAHARDISVVLGTPTYAMPPWLVRKYPEVTGERATGRPIPYGHRQDADLSHPAFRWYAGRITRAVVGRYADHPAVIGYQVDNEPGIELLHNRGAFHGFVDRLRTKYGDVDTLNERWGLTYWSHRIARWDELWVPDGNTVPSYDLEWRRYQAAITTDFITEQAAIVREIARPDQFITTCMALPRPAFDPADLNRALDVAAVNPYYPMQDALTMPSPPPEAARSRLGWSALTGAWAIYLQADLARGARDQRFLVTETNALSIGGAHANFPAYDGQWRQAAWALVARGARMVEYWHWHSTPRWPRCDGSPRDRSTSSTRATTTGTPSTGSGSCCASTAASPRASSSRRRSTATWPPATTRASACAGRSRRAWSAWGSSGWGWSTCTIRSTSPSRRASPPMGR
jgi:beta-galactosidase